MMAIRADSYGSTGELKAITRHMLRGQSGFNSTTTPTLTDVEKFIDRASAAVNVAIRVRGLTTPITNSTAKLDCDNWVVGKSAEFVELVLRGAGSREQTGTSRFQFMPGLSEDAEEFVSLNSLGWIRLGVPETNRMSDGLVFTGETAQADRTDPDDTTLAQPSFKRNLFDAS